MGKTTIKIKELEKVLEEMPKTKIEKECKSWGCATPSYEEVVNISSVMFYVKKFINGGV